MLIDADVGDWQRDELSETDMNLSFLCGNYKIKKIKYLHILGQSSPSRWH